MAISSRRGYNLPKPEWLLAFARHLDQIFAWEYDRTCDIGIFLFSSSVTPINTGGTFIPAAFARVS
jgi:hypothetical protein